MKYEHIINSGGAVTVARSQALAEGVELTFYNSLFVIRGEVGHPVPVDNRLYNLNVIAEGPAPVWLSGEANLRAEGSVVVHASENSYVEARASSTVYAYGNAVVSARDDATVYARSDSVTVTATGRTRVFLPQNGQPGAEAAVDGLKDSATVIQEQA
jgi:hypothetical protein